MAANPAYLEARLSLARVLAALDRKDEARREYLAVLALRPDLREAGSGLRALLTDPSPFPGGLAPSR